MALSSCGLQVAGEFRGPITGLKYTTDGVLVDEKTAAKLIQSGSRIIAGDDIKQSLLEPISLPRGLK